LRPKITAFIAVVSLLALVCPVARAAQEPRFLDDALTAQQRLVRNRPNDAGAVNDLGNLYHLGGNLVSAEEAYRRALEINPEFTPALYNLALLLQQTGERKEAKRTLDSMLELDPDHGWGHFQMGMILDASKKFDRAAAHYARAFVIDPGLMEIGRNPQILDSRLATRARAMLMAYAERMARLEAAPREYYRPDRITRLLVPEAKAAAERGRAARAKESGGKADKPSTGEQDEPKRKRRQKPKEAEADKDDNEDDTGGASRP
jgi:tetratricopeptide (TPR) repeat protein